MRATEAVTGVAILLTFEKISCKASSVSLQRTLPLSPAHIPTWTSMTIAITGSSSIQGPSTTSRQAPRKNRRRQIVWRCARMQITSTMLGEG